MRIKVIKCNGDEWYKDCINREFQVSESRQEGVWVARLEPKDRQMVEGSIYGLINMKDCEVVEEVCGSPYSDLWVRLGLEIEHSDYCKKTRESDEVKAFGIALCEKCFENKCEFIDICIRLYEMNKQDHEELEDIDES